MKKIDFKILGGFALIAVFVISGLLVGNNQQTEAKNEPSAISINLTMSDIKGLISDLRGFMGLGEVETPILRGVTNYDSLTLGDDLIVGKTSTLTGTTTLTQSVDGLVIGGEVSTTATGTVVTIYTNSTGPKMCVADTGYVYAKSIGFSPALVFSMGTTSATAIQSTNLIASTTLATTTTTYLEPLKSLFLLNNGELLTAIFDDTQASAASSTYYDNWDVEVGIWCQDVSI